MRQISVMTAGFSLLPVLLFGGVGAASIIADRSAAQSDTVASVPSREVAVGEETTGWD